MISQNFKPIQSPRSVRQNFIDDEDTIMIKTKSLTGKLTPEFIDYANDKGVDLIKWYRWQLHLIWEQRNIQRKLSTNYKRL